MLKLDHSVGNATGAWLAPAARRFDARLLALILLHVAIGCVSLMIVAQHQSYMLFDRQYLAWGVGVSAAFAAIAILFAIAPFSFGYFSGFYLFTIVSGFLWLNCFSQYKYDHTTAGLSAAVSALAFLLPATGQAREDDPSGAVPFEERFASLSGLALVD